MIWVVWRQHRKQALMGAFALVAIAALLIPTGISMRNTLDSTEIDRCQEDAQSRAFISVEELGEAKRPPGPSNGGCAQIASELQNDYSTLMLLLVVLLTLPLFAGLFWGAPLIAREIEHGTHRLVWTQGITRRRWATWKFGLVGAGVVVFASIFSVLITWWITPFNTAIGNRFVYGIFDQQGIVLVGYTLFAVALGIFAGTLLRRSTAAMALTLFGFVAVRLFVAGILRHRFLSSETRRYAVGGGKLPNPLRGDWIMQRGVFAPDGTKLTTASDAYLVCTSEPGSAGAAGGVKAGAIEVVGPSCDGRNIDGSLMDTVAAGAYNQDVFHTGNHFWLFQGIEFAIFVGLALLLLFATMRLIKRRG